MPAPAFAAAIVDILGATAVNVRSSVDAMPDCDVKRDLEFFLQSTGDDVSLLQKNIEQWFENTMDRVSGWYKTRVQIVTAAIAIGVTIFANADTLENRHRRRRCIEIRRAQPPENSPRQGKAGALAFSTSSKCINPQGKTTTHRLMGLRFRNRKSKKACAPATANSAEEAYERRLESAAA